MSTKTVVKRNSYRDSVFLMVVSREARSLPGVLETAAMMGTANNKNILRDVGFGGSEIESATANDLILCVKGETGAAVDEAFACMEERLNRKPAASGGEDVYRTLDSALRDRPSANLALISVPGEFAAREARKALKRGLNVMLFSDNVGIEEEVALKEQARSLGRIVMGPDCGTAIINQVPLAFSNVVVPGPIGLVAASGTGLQEVVCQIHRRGLGISQAIGVGGRDLSDRVGGISTLTGLEILEQDPMTEVIVIISKPPGAETMKRVIRRAAQCGKKVIACFMGADSGAVSESGIEAAQTLEEAAARACSAVKGAKYEAVECDMSPEKLREIVYQETRRMSPDQKYVRGLFSGGTLCDEAMMILSPRLGGVYSNIPLSPEWKLQNPPKGIRHACIDLGEDYFTTGRPHPMIESDIRSRYICDEAADPEVAVLMLDVVLGYGSHMDMAGALSESIRTARRTAEKRGGYLSVVASVCGTSGDPQGLDSQVEKLKDCGVVVMPSNAQASRLAAMVACGKGKPGND